MKIKTIRKHFNVFFLGLLPVLLGYTKCFGQHDVSNRIGIQAGWTNTTIYDQHTSPLLYQANTFDVGMVYQRQAALLLEISLNLRLGSNQSKVHGKRIATLGDTPDIYGNVSESQIEVNPFLSMMNVDLKVALLWEINGQHSLGASFRGKHMLAAISADTWHYTQLDLAPEYRFRYPFEKTSWHAEFRLPLIAGIVRPNFAKDASLPEVHNYWVGYVKTNFKVVSLNHLFNPDIHIGFQRQLAKGNRVGATYSLSLLTYPLPRPVKMLEQGVQLQYYF